MQIVKCAALAGLLSAALSAQAFAARIDTVFFGPGSAVLASGAAAVVNLAARDAAAHPGVAIIGYADRAAGENEGTALHRARTVRDALLAHGVPANTIAFVGTASDSMGGVASRRVAIEVGVALAPEKSASLAAGSE